METINTQETLIGEKLSFFQLFQQKGYSIMIPIIQRDYAQGRASTKDIRDSFLETLYDHLLSSKPIDLDFVYGSIEEGDQMNFVPLDGQQRLTTLFLLHWYIAQNEKRYDEFRIQLFEEISNFSRFSYKVRTSSTEFCDALINSKFNFHQLLESDKGKDNALSKTIRDTSWYFLSWEQDPTIKSMLCMLDAIHHKFHHTQGLFDKLVDTTEPVITFQFLDLGEFKLTDDLYIKMNARGKPLTSFENFKAKFEQHIKDISFDQTRDFRFSIGSATEKFSIPDYFSHKIDTDWADLFWNYRNSENLFDDQLMNFIRVMAANHFALKETDEGSIKGLWELFGKEDPEVKGGVPTVSFAKYLALECFDGSFVLDLVRLLDKISNGTEKVKQHLNLLFYYDEREVFNEVIVNQLSYTQRIKFFAYVKYLLNYESLSGLDEWMRIVHNLAENTIYNRAVEYSRSIKAINVMIPHAGDILNYLSNRNNPFDGFNERQVMEERVKACLILKSDVWGAKIYDAEQHSYFKGQIGFLLAFSNVSQYFDQYEDTSWTDLEDISMLEKFNRYFSQATSVFGPKGLVELDSSMWERALLSKGDYLLSKGQNYSFLIDNDRDISWKRLLKGNDKGDSETESRRAFIKEIFDDPLFDEKNLQASLRTIISASEVSDWRRSFIHFPQLIGVCGNSKFIRFGNEGNFILLLEKTATNGAHREYYTYALKCELEKHYGAKVDCFAENSVDVEKSISKINDFKIKIAYGIYEHRWTFYTIYGEDTMLHSRVEDVIEYLIEQLVVTTIK